MRGTLLLPLVVGCDRHQSALSPFDEEAADIVTLTTALTVGAAVIGVGMLALMWAAVRAPGGRLTLSGGERLILWAGGAGPAVLLLALLAYSLRRERPTCASRSRGNSSGGGSATNRIAPRPSSPPTRCVCPWGGWWCCA